MRKQPWFVLFVLASAMLACSLFDGSVLQQTEESIAPSPEPTQDLRRQNKQTTPTATETAERSSTEDEPQQTSTPAQAPTENSAPEAEPGPTRPDLKLYQVNEDFDLKVVGVSFEEKEFGKLYVHGFLENTESFSLYPKKIFIVIVDENGNEMLSDSIYSDFHMIPAGRKAPFRFSLYPWNEVPEDADGAIFDLEVKDFGYSTYSWDLEVVDSEGKLKPQNHWGYEYEIEAEVKNVSAETMRYIHGYAAIFDAEGNLLKTWNANVVPQNLAPGETASVEADIPYDYPGIDHFEFYLEGSIFSE